MQRLRISVNKFIESKGKAMINQYEKDAKIFKALCDPNRLMIIKMLQGGDKCACKILEDLNIVQSTLSHHMKILCESGLVESARVGKWMHYSYMG